jgi:hypothetical protein
LGLVVACAKESAAPAAPEESADGGTGGAARGGAGGRAQGGTGGAVATGSGGVIAPATGGAGGVAIEGADAAADVVEPDAPASDASATSDDTAGADTAVALGDPKTWPGGAYSKPFIIECPPGAPREACCLHYCTCMSTNCMRQAPADCMAACVSPNGVAKWDLRCRVYNCFESLNPLATKDHTAHCEHAGVYTGSQRTRGAGDTHAKCHLPGEPDEP